MKLIKSIKQLIDQFNYHRQHTDETVHPTATPKAAGFASPEMAGNALHTKENETVDNVFNTKGGELAYYGSASNNSPINSGLSYLTTYSMSGGNVWLAFHSWTGSIFVANKHSSSTSPLPQKKWRSLTTSTPIVGFGNNPITLTNNTFTVGIKKNLNLVNYKIIYGFEGNWNTITLTKNEFIGNSNVNIPLNIIIPERGGSTIRVSYKLQVQPNGTATLSKNFIEQVSANGVVSDVTDRDNNFQITRVFEEYGQDQNVNELN